MEGTKQSRDEVHLDIFLGEMLVDLRNHSRLIAKKSPALELTKVLIVKISLKTREIVCNTCSVLAPKVCNGTATAFLPHHYTEDMWPPYARSESVSLD